MQHVFSAKKKRLYFEIRGNPDEIDKNNKTQQKQHNKNKYHNNNNIRKQH
jgi:hypothetical protein